MKITEKYLLNMKKLIALLILNCSFLIGFSQSTPTPKPINQYPWDSLVGISNDQIIINHYIGPGRYQVEKITPRNFFACDSLKQNALTSGQDSIRVTINRDTIKTSIADSLNDYIVLTPYVNSASLWISAIHTGHYFVVKSIAWSKNNLFNWVIIHK